MSVIRSILAYRRSRMLQSMGVLAAALGCDDPVVTEAPILCAGEAGLGCAEGSYCRERVIGGQCPGPSVLGECALRPPVCDPLDDPVCGCDGTTYGNACEAAAAGAAVASSGECDGVGELCNSNEECRAGQYCVRPVGSCAEDGRCEARPEACTLEFDPVCGCDGETYGNACEAARAGASVGAAAECE